jgi:DNA (cytosine-5)-methyltransferase 1
MRPRYLDLYCGAGLAADGWHAAGYEIVGVDLNPQPDYPYTFIQANALELLAGTFGDDFDVIGASPPCQLHTRAGHLRTAQGGRSKYPDLLTPTLQLLKARWFLTPWIVENVEAAAKVVEERPRLTLCGSMFAPFKVKRHRHFWSNVPLGPQPVCHHDRFEADPVTGKPRPWGVYHVRGDSIPKGGRTCRDAAHAAECMGVQRDIPWQGLKEGYPPAYSEHIGRQFMTYIPQPTTQQETRNS